MRIRAPGRICSPERFLIDNLESQTMDWVPVVFIVFKILVFGAGMFFAVKWHYDQGKEGRHRERRATLRKVGKVAAVFVLLLALLLFATFTTSRMLGLNLNF